MADEIPARAEWSALYAAAARVYDLAPWQWMAEDDIFGVRDPETGELAFASVMGAAGEHYAVSVYLGARALYQFWDIEDEDEETAIAKLLEIPQLQASFESREDLEGEDLDTIKKLGLKFRGKNAWPLFRSLRPGFLPWFVEAGEARLLTIILDQLAEVAPRLREDPELLTPTDDDDSYLVREQTRGNGSPAWADKVEHIPTPEPETLHVNVEIEDLERVKALPRRKGALEIDLFILPAPINDEGSRPRLPYMLMVVDAQSRKVLAGELLIAEPSVQAMWSEIPARVLGVFVQTGARPTEIRVSSELLSNILPPLAEEIGAKFKQVDELPALLEARMALMEEMMSDAGFSDPVG